MAELSTGDAQQLRIIAEAFAEQLMTRFPPPSRVEIPAPIKWAAGIISAILAMSAAGGVHWLATSVNDMQGTLIRIDERQQAASSSQDSRFSEMERRVAELESFHRKSN